MQDDLTVSICIITYNQKSFIEQALKSAINQSAGFKYEIIVGDDFSSDGTRQLLVEYQKKYPHLIKLILHSKKNEGIPGKANFLSTLTAASGKYIALLDGDDYWIDKNKLQKQVDFLETHPDYAICCHRIYIKKDNQKPKLYPDEYMPSSEVTYDIEMIAKHGNLVATPSVVYRNKLFSSLPAWFGQSPIGDYVLHMMNAQYGKIKYFPEPMAVYREHSKGVWSGQTVMANAANMIKVIGLLLTEPFDQRVKKDLKYQLQVKRAIYLNELMHEDWNRFDNEFEQMMEEDKAVAIALIEKIKADMDAIKQSRTYRAAEKLKKFTKRIRKQ